MILPAHTRQGRFARNKAVWYNTSGLVRAYRGGIIMKKLFSEIPYLRSERLELKKLEESDADGLNELAHSKAVNRFLPTFLYEQKYEDSRYVIRHLYDECFEKSIILGIFMDGQFCGLAEFYGYRDNAHKISVGNRLLERYWGMGISTEALGMMIDYLFNETDIELITASTLPGNTASANVLKKNGFVLAASGTDEDWGYEDPLPTNVWFRKKQPGEGADRR